MPPSSGTMLGTDIHNGGGSSTGSVGSRSGSRSVTFQLDHHVQGGPMGDSESSQAVPQHFQTQDRSFQPSSSSHKIVEMQQHRIPTPQTTTFSRPPRPDSSWRKSPMTTASGSTSSHAVPVTPSPPSRTSSGPSSPPRTSTAAPSASSSKDGTVPGSPDSGRLAERVGEAWRKHGKLHRAQLILMDEEKGGNSFVLSDGCAIDRYYRVAERVLEQFLSTGIGEAQELKESYLVGNRLVKFLSVVLPTHGEYFSDEPRLANLRQRSQAQLIELLQYMEELALLIDEMQFNKYILKDLTPEDEKTTSFLSEDTSLNTSNASDSITTYQPSTGTSIATSTGTSIGPNKETRNLDVPPKPTHEFHATPKKVQTRRTDPRHLATIPSAESKESESSGSGNVAATRRDTTSTSSMLSKEAIRQQKFEQAVAAVVVAEQDSEGEYEYLSQNVDYLNEHYRAHVHAFLNSQQPPPPPPPPPPPAPPERRRSHMRSAAVHRPPPLEILSKPILSVGSNDDDDEDPWNWGISFSDASDTPTRHSSIDLLDDDGPSSFQQPQPQPLHTPVLPLPLPPPPSSQPLSRSITSPPLSVPKGNTLAQQQRITPFPKLRQPPAPPPKRKQTGTDFDPKSPIPNYMLRTMVDEDKKKMKNVPSSPSTATASSSSVEMDLVLAKTRIEKRLDRAAKKQQKSHGRQPSRRDSKTSKALVQASSEQSGSNRRLLQQFKGCVRCLLE